MAPTIVTATLPLVYNQEVSFGSIAGGPFDFIDGFVDVGIAGVVAEWRLYATVGGVQSLVATAQGGGEEAQVLDWNVGGAGMPSTPAGPFNPGPQGGPYSPAKAAATSYELRAFLATSGQPSAPAPAAAASLVGYDQLSTAVDTAASSTQLVPANFSRVTLATVPGYANSADVSVSIDSDVPVKITLWAVAGGVTAPVPNGTLTINQASSTPRRVFSPNRLPGATSYFITAEFDATQLMIAPAAPVHCTASLCSQSTWSGGAPPIAPGPQITVLRSVVPTAPTKVVWASSGYIDFVADCGADPTGVADCAPAFNTAFALLSALSALTPATETAVRLFIPPGLYGLKSAPAAWNFVNLTTNCEIVGAGCDATIIQLYGFDPPAVGTLQRFRLADLTMQGTTAGNDCVQGWAVASTAQLAMFERVRFFNVQAQLACAYFVYCVGVHIKDCVTVCVSSQTAGWGAITVQGCLNTHYESNVHYDVGFLNGLGNGTEYVGNRAWFAYIGDHLKGGDQLITISDCFFDEHARAQISIVGEAAFPIPSLIIRNVECNSPVDDGVPADMIACLNLKNVTYVDIDGFSNNSFNTSPTSVAPTILASAVEWLNVRNLIVPPHPPANSNYITVDNTCGVLNLAQSPTLSTANIHSLAAVNIIDGVSTVQAAAWYVDPANSTLAASDQNLGTDPTHPCLTYSRGILSRWGTTSPVIPQNTTLTWLSSQPAPGPGITNDFVVCNPKCEGVTFTIQGSALTGAPVHAGMLAGVVAKVQTAAGHPLEADLGFAATPGQLVVNTNVAGGKSSYAFVDHLIAGTTFALTQPLAPTALPALSANPTELNNWANADTFDVYDLTSVWIAEADPMQLAEYTPTFIACMQINQINFASANGAGNSEAHIGSHTFVSESSFDVTLVDTSGTTDVQTGYVNCFAPFDAVSKFGGTVFGVWYGGALHAVTGTVVNFVFDYDAILDSSAAGTNGFMVSQPEHLQTFPLSMGTFYINGTIILRGDVGFVNGRTAIGTALVYGPGTLNVNGASRVFYNLPAAQSAANTFKCAALQLNGQGNANAFNPGTNVWTGPIALTAANLDLATGAGGFGGLAVNVGGASFSNQATP